MSNKATPSKTLISAKVYISHKKPIEVECDRFNQHEGFFWFFLGDYTVEVISELEIDRIHFNWV